MKNKRSLAVAVCLGLSALTSGIAQAVDYTDARPLSQVVKSNVQACGAIRPVPVPLIAWGGDMVTILGNGNTDVTAKGSLFDTKGLSLKLYREDRFVKQVEDYLSCKTPFLRGTVGMIAQANDVISADARTKPVVINQLTFSEGGDVLVVRDYIKTPKDLCGKTVALQAYGPHVDLLTTVLKDAGCPGNVKIKWTKDITENPKDKNSVYPARALREDKSVDAVFVISPDADGLTNGKGEGRVKGAWSLFSTKTANRVIADVYVVRKDYFDAHPGMVESFVNGQFVAYEAAAKLVAEKDGKSKAPYNAWLAASAKMLLDSASSVNDAAGMWGDAKFAGWKGNVSFFADSNFPRRLDVLALEAGTAFGPAGLKLIGKAASFTPAMFDYTKLGNGVVDKDSFEASHFNKAAVDALVRERQQKDTVSDGTLFTFEIRFKPNQQSFSSDLYKADFDRVVNLTSTYGGALLTIEGHADTLEYLKRKGNAAATPEELSRMKQGAKNLTLQRANAVRDSLLGYAKSKKMTIDANQVSAIGYGFTKPNVSGCKLDQDGDVTVSCAPRSEEEWNAMRRVVFRVVSVEAESSQFEALGAKK